MAQRKLAKPTDQRMALLRGQVSELLWHGRIETTYDRAKEVQKMAEKILTAAINSYKDTVKEVETRKRVGKKGAVEEYKLEVVNDGPKKLAARRKIMGVVYDIPETPKENESKTSFRERTAHVRHPLIEKIFNEYAPKYDARAEELGQKGCYTRVLKMGFRRGDSAELALIELV